MRPKWMLETNVLPMAPDFSDSAGEIIGPHPNALVPIISALTIGGPISIPKR